MKAEQRFMRLALRLARRGIGRTSPNPMVGAVLVRSGRIIGRGWHRRAGLPHAEIEAMRDAERRGERLQGATLYVTLEPCCTHGRTPPCTEAIQAAGIRRVVSAATDPNPAHRGRGFRWLRTRGIRVETGMLGEEATVLNERFNHWMRRRLPHVTVKAAMTLDGKIATAAGESKWITSPESRGRAMRLRAAVDAILVGVETVRADDPALTVRLGGRERAATRVVLDTRGRTPLTARLISDRWRDRTIVVVGRGAAERRRRALARRVRVWVAPLREGRIDPRWVLRRLAAAGITSVLVEGGGEVNSSFLMRGMAQRVCFVFAPKVLGGRGSRRSVGGDGARDGAGLVRLRRVQGRRCGPDYFLEAEVDPESRGRAGI